MDYSTLPLFSDSNEDIKVPFPSSMKFILSNYKHVTKPSKSLEEIAKIRIRDERIGKTATAISKRGKKLKNVQMSNFRIPVNEVEIPIRIFSHSNKAPNSTNRLFIHFHGGGWVHGDLDFYSPTCLRYAYHFDATVISVDYRKSPEHKFPIPFTDCANVAKWIIENKCIFGKKEIPIYLIGESAGGNLVAAVTQYLRDHQINEIKGQILMYPVTDSSIDYHSVEKFKKGFLLTKESLIYFLDAYKSKDEDTENPYFAPIKASNFENIPPTIIVTDSHDVLRDQGYEYHKKLKDNDVECYYRNYLLTLHGFLNAPELFFRGSEMYKDFIQFIKEIFIANE